MNDRSDQGPADGALSPRSSIRTAVLAGVLIPALVILIYGRALEFPFLKYYDDGLHVFDNPLVRQGWGSHLLQAWAGTYQQLYVPLAYTVWALISELTGGASASAATLPALPFHAANILLFTGCVGLIWLFARSVLKNGEAALWATLLFACHPMQVEIVAWVTGLRDVLALASAAAALASFASADLAERPFSGRLRLAAAAIFASAAIFSKPQAVVLAPMLGILALWLDPRRKARWAAVGAVTAVAVGAALMTVGAQTDGAVGPVAAMVRFLHAIEVLGFYGVKAVVPEPVLSDYGFQPWKALHPGYFLYVLPGALWAWSGIVALRRRSGLAPLGMALGLIALLPALGLHQFYYQNRSTVADRYGVWALIGLSMAAGAGYMAAQRRWPEESRVRRVFALAVIALFAWRSVEAVSAWRSDEARCEKVLESDPDNFFATVCMGQVQEERGRDDEALRLYTKASRLLPGFHPLHAHVAKFHMRRKRFPEAVQAASMALRLDPRNASYLVNLGTLHGLQGDLASAERLFTQALEVNPGMEAARANLEALKTGILFRAREQEVRPGALEPPR